MTSGSSWTNIFGGTAVRPAQPSYEALTIAANTALVWPLESAGGSPYVAAQIDVTASAGGLSVLMPPGNQGSNGPQSLISNVGADTFTLTDHAGNAIVQIAASQTWLITLTDNTTANGTWRAVQWGATTSSASAGALAGPGLQAAGSELQTIINTTSLNTNTLLTASYRATLIVWTGANGTITLDASASLGAGWYCAIHNEGTGDITLTGTGGETVDGNASVTIHPQDSGYIVCKAGAFNSIGALIGTIPITGGGTGAATAPSALTNFGGTTIGQAIFTAPNAAAVLALLGQGGFITSVVQQVFTSSGTYTPTAGMQYCVAEMVAGGAGGGPSATTAGHGGGGAGEYARGIFSAATVGASQTVTVPAAATNVQAGGTVSLGALLTAHGGSLPVTAQYGGPGGSGGTGTGLHVPGGDGGAAPLQGASIIWGGQGGASFFGGGGRGGQGNLDPGQPGRAYGSGGGGGGYISGTDAAGGAGGPPLLIIIEFCGVSS